MSYLPDWRAARSWELQLARDLRYRHTLWLHGFWIGLITLAVTWGISALQMRMGFESLALRYLVSLGTGYLAYLLILRLWAAILIRRANLDAPDVPSCDGLSSNSGGGSTGAPRPPSMESGGGGDFGGGGASGDFAVDAPGVADGMGEMAGSAIEVAAGSDEAAIVVVPLVAVFLMGCAVFFGAGSLLLLYFGWEVLLAVAVELAFSYATASAAVRATREGWTSAAVRRTWKPLAGALVCAVTLGAAIDHFIPTANSLPQAVKVLKTRLTGPVDE